MSSRVLVVDDSPVIRSVVKIYLQKYPLEFVEAENGDRALQLLALVSVDLVIADVNMPGTNGLAFLKKLRESPPPLRTVPVILLTGEKSPTLLASAASAGADALLKKPVSSAGLTEAVKTLLARTAVTPV